MSEGAYSRVHFRVHAETSIGQTIGIGGTCAPLGGLQKNRVVQLVTTPESYPIWYTATPIVIPRNKIIEYKYCVMEGGSCKFFENSESSRSFTSLYMDTMVEDVFQVDHVEGTESEADLLTRLSSVEESSGGSKKKVTSNNDFQAVLQSLSPNALYIVCYHLPVVVKRKANPNADGPPFEGSIPKLYSISQF